jgi:hypothetical protein
MCSNLRNHAAQASGSYHRAYDVPAKSGEEAHALWVAALTAKGWTRTPAAKPKGDYGYDATDCSIVDRFDRGPLRINLRVDKCNKTRPGFTEATLDRTANAKAP